MSRLPVFSGDCTTTKCAPSALFFAEIEAAGVDEAVANAFAAEFELVRAFGAVALAAAEMFADAAAPAVVDCGAPRKSS